MTGIMRSQIFQTGTKFVVTEDSKDTTYGTGSVGFTSFVKGKDQDFRNVAYIDFVCIQRGKSGKQRVEAGEISMPIFELPEEHAKDFIPDEKRKFFVHIDPVENENPSVLSFPAIDFIGWAYSWVRYLEKLDSKTKHISAWPKGDKFMDRFKRIPGNFAEDPTQTIDLCASTEARTEFIRKARTIECTLMKCSLLYMHRVAEIEFEACGMLAKSIKDSKLPFVQTLQLLNSKIERIRLLREMKGNTAKKPKSSWSKSL